jgi:hypothetical protein
MSRRNHARQKEWALFFDFCRICRNKMHWIGLKYDGHWTETRRQLSCCSPKPRLNLQIPCPFQLRSHPPAA